jgi:hypothetical protein
VVMTHHQRVELNDSLLIGNKSSESVAKFAYLGTTITDRNCIHEEIKSRLNFWNACYNSVYSLLPVSINLKIKIYKKT